ncbi:hypothetical protein N658DRAFT_517408 [Parathielavia hyrcaniae]|uniref:Zinc transporter n=1 Tax=Parathielavia hyrcaniae TaxID=113614 RepID=A0AAN6Q075_9PEZI|nr:hypothetical protein N658DRAFT_517408 [Parathielavia hyrcaniae]
MMLTRCQPRGVVDGAVILLLFVALVLLMSWGSFKNTATSWELEHEQAAGLGHGDALAPTAVSECRLEALDESRIICVSGAAKYLVHTSATATATSELPPQYTGCHTHDAHIFCLGPDGDDVRIERLEDGTSTTKSGGEGDAGGRHCHFHAGVEHCVGGDVKANASTGCERVDRDYNIPLRIGALVVVLFTSAAAVYGPILAAAVLPATSGLIPALLKQFGTGVIMSTAFVHLFTHAILQFQNECLGGLSYEATPAVILMAGIFVSFLADYLVHEMVAWRATRKGYMHVPEGDVSAELANVAILEAGIVFHSLLIGITLVVTGDAFFGTLAIVIVFHQAFEGLALGTRIASIGSGRRVASLGHHDHHHGHHHHHHSSGPGLGEAAPLSGESIITSPAAVSTARKLLLASGFALVTPLGMAIGIALLSVFNGNDPSTIVAIGSIDAFSAGILVWVGIVEMWAHDWMAGGEVARLDPRGKLCCLAALVGGMGSMSYLGKWA